MILLMIMEGMKLWVRVRPMTPEVVVVESKETGDSHWRRGDSRGALDQGKRASEKVFTGPVG